MEEATEKAVILARAAVAKVMLDTPLTPGESRVVKRALVIGGGIAGIRLHWISQMQAMKNTLERSSRAGRKICIN